MLAFYRIYFFTCNLIQDLMAESFTTVSETTSVPVVFICGEYPAPKTYICMMYCIWLVAIGTCTHAQKTHPCNNHCWHQCFCILCMTDSCGRKSSEKDKGSGVEIVQKLIRVTTWFFFSTWQEGRGHTRRISQNRLNKSGFTIWLETNGQTIERGNLIRYYTNKTVNMHNNHNFDGNLILWFGTSPLIVGTLVF